LIYRLPFVPLFFLPCRPTGSLFSPLVMKYSPLTSPFLAVPFGPPAHSPPSLVTCFLSAVPSPRSCGFFAPFAPTYPHRNVMLCLLRLLDSLVFSFARINGLFWPQTNFLSLYFFSWLALFPLSHPPTLFPIRLRKGVYVFFTFPPVLARIIYFYSV